MAVVVFLWRTYGQVVGLRKLPDSPDGPVVAFERVRSTGLRRLLLANSLILAAASIATFAKAGTTFGAIFTAALVPMAIGGAYLQNWFWARPYRDLSNKGIERTAQGSINQ
jgi:hypothetical protein